MLRIEPVPTLYADASAVAMIAYEPACAQTVELKLTAAHGAHICDVRSTLLDGTHLATRLQPGPAGVRLSLGYLEVPVLVHVTLRADVPVETACATLTVAAGEELQVAHVPLVGRPRFLAERSGLRLSAAQARPAAQLALTVAGTNDGTAVAREVRVHLVVPQDVTLDAGLEAWREVSPAGDRTVVIPIERVEVGERFCREVAIKVAPLSQDQREIAFVGWLVAAEARFDLEPVTLVVRSAAHAVAKLKVLENRLYRFGDRLSGVVTLKAHGTDAVREAVVRVTSPGISWVDADEEGGLPVRFGTIAPFGQASRLIEGVVVAAPSGKQPVAIALDGAAGQGILVAHGTSVTVVGAARVQAMLTVTAASAEQAHRVELVLRNTGDGTAASVVVAAPPIGQVVGVVDSLLVDGQPRFALDGSLLIERGGFEAGPLGIAAERRLTWQVRSAVAQRALVVTSIAVDGAVIIAEAEADLVAGAGRERGAGPVDSAPAAALEPSFEKICEATLALSAAVHTLEDADRLNEGTALSVDPAVAPSTETAEDALPGVSYELGARAAARWSAWFGEGGPAPDAPLGMHVLAAREFLPVGASSAAADAALAGIHSESEGVVRARLESYKVLGVFGASGFEFGTPRLRAAVGSIMGILGHEPCDLAGVGLDRALVALTGASGTDLVEVLGRYRDALARVLADVDELSRYGDHAPEMHLPARALFEALVRVAVAR